MTDSTDSSERPTQYFVVAVFVSLVIHMSFACLLWVVVSGRIAVEPETSTIETHLIVSLNTFTTASHNGMDLEVVPDVPHTEPPAQRSQSPPERSRSAGHKSETETVVTSKDKGVPDLEAPDDKSLEAYSTLSFDLDTVYRMTWEFEKMPEFKAETVEIWKGQGTPGSEAPGNKSLAAYLTPSYNLEDYYHMKREFERMSESEYQYIMFKSRKLNINNYIVEYNRDPRLDCRTAYAGAGLFAIPFLIKDAITGNGCKWRPVVLMSEQLGHMDITNRTTSDTFETLLPVKVYNNKIIFNITKEGKICIKGIKLDLNAIKGIMEVFKNEYPDGSVIITYEGDFLYKIALDVFDQAREAKVKIVVMARQ